MRSVALSEAAGHLAVLAAQELESLDETLFWLRDESGRACDGEPPGGGEDEPGIGEREVHVRYGHLLPRRDLA